MRVLLMVLGSLAIALGGAAFYLSTQNQVEDRNVGAIRLALKSQTKAATEEVAREFATRSQLAQEITLSSRDLRSKTTKPLLEQAGAPNLLLVRSSSALRELKPKRAEIGEDTRTAALAFFGRSQKIGFWQGSDNKAYIFTRGEQGDLAWVAVYRQDSLFTKIRGSTAIRPWVALADGTVLFHALARYTGVNSISVRPFAQGAENLKLGLQNEMLANYVGLEGQEILGAWATLPEWGLVVGSEWPALSAAKNSVPLLVWIAIGGFILGAFLIGACVTPKPVQVTAAKREVKDLSHEARAFIKKAERQAADALRFAEDRDRECAELEAKAREQLGKAERTRWIFERSESFLEEAIEAKEDKQVWRILSDYLSAMALKAPALVFTYSPSSCSLIPQSQASLEGFPENARLYLADARMLVGDIQALNRLEATSAFQQWRERLERFQPLSGRRIFSLPFASPTGSRGVVLFLFLDNMMTEAEIAKQRELWDLFAYRAAWLYDLKRRLLQSKHAVAKRIEKSNLSQNPARDRSPQA